MDCAPLDVSPDMARAQLPLIAVVAVANIDINTILDSENDIWGGQMWRIQSFTCGGLSRLLQLQGFLWGRGTVL